MKRRFHDAVMELMRNGEEPLVALKRIEESREFNEEEVATWFERFNNRQKKKTNEI